MIINEPILGATYGIPDSKIIRLTPVSSSRYNLIIEDEPNIWVIEKRKGEWILLCDNY